MEATIMRSEVMRIIDSGAPFTMEFVTADRRRGTGGELIQVKHWKKVTATASQTTSDNRVLTEKKPSLLKSPNHSAHKTINIFNPGNHHLHPHKVHYRLILSFNEKRVING